VLSTPIKEKKEKEWGLGVEGNGEGEEAIFIEDLCKRKSTDYNFQIKARKGRD